MLLQGFNSLGNRPSLSIRSAARSVLHRRNTLSFLPPPLSAMLLQRLHSVSNRPSLLICSAVRSVLRRRNTFPQSSFPTPRRFFIVSSSCGCVRSPKKIKKDSCTRTRTTNKEQPGSCYEEIRWREGRGADGAGRSALGGRARGPGHYCDAGRTPGVSILHLPPLSVLVCRSKPPRACGRRTRGCDVCAQSIDFDTVQLRCRRVLESRPASFMLFACAAAAALQLSCRSIASWARARKIVGPTVIARPPAPQQRKAGMPRSWTR
jgi:hypothetical protein